MKRDLANTKRGKGSTREKEKNCASSKALKKGTKCGLEIGGVNESRGGKRKKRGREKTTGGVSSGGGIEE